MRICCGVVGSGTCSGSATGSGSAPSSASSSPEEGGAIEGQRARLCASNLRISCSRSCTCACTTKPGAPTVESSSSSFSRTGRSTTQGKSLASSIFPARDASSGGSSTREREEKEKESSPRLSPTRDSSDMSDLKVARAEEGGERVVEDAAGGGAGAGVEAERRSAADVVRLGGLEGFVGVRAGVGAAGSGRLGPIDMLSLLCSGTASERNSETGSRRKRFVLQHLLFHHHHHQSPSA